MKIANLLTPDVETVSPDDSLVAAADLMRELDVGSVPVTQNDAVVGIVTDRDIVTRAVAYSLDPEETPVRNVMSSDIQAVFLDDDSAEALRIMQQHKIRRLPVLNRDGRLVGIVSLGDVAVDGGTAEASGTALREISDPSSPAR